MNCPTFTDFDRMVTETKPELLTVTTVDAYHSEYIVKALDRGIDVITEKPMVIDEMQCQAVLDAEKRNNRKINVAFNYRFAPKHVKIKELLMAGAIGPVRSVDFHCGAAEFRCLIPAHYGLLLWHASIPPQAY